VGVRVLLDTSACIYFLHGAGDPRFSVVEAVLRDRPQTFLSVITVAELLVKPTREHDRRGLAIVNAFVEQCTISAIEMSIAREAAALRATHRLKLPDALIIATARDLNVDLTVGNDRAWADLAPNFRCVDDVQ
jgi:predicted nucleic acid-binding protein